MLHPMLTPTPSPAIEVPSDGDARQGLPTMVAPAIAAVPVADAPARSAPPPMLPVVPVSGDAVELLVPQVMAPEVKLRCWPAVSAQAGMAGMGILELDCPPAIAAINSRAHVNNNSLIGLRL